MSSCGLPRQLHLSTSPGRTDSVLLGLYRTAHHALSVAGFPDCPPKSRHPAKRVGAPKREPSSTAQCWGTQADPCLQASVTPSVQQADRRDGCEVLGSADGCPLSCPPLCSPGQKSGSRTVGAGSQRGRHTHSAMVKASSKFFCRCVGLRAL